MERVDAIGVAGFSPAKIAVSQMFFSQMTHRAVFKVIFKDQAGAEKPPGTTIFPHPAPGAQYQLARFAREIGAS
jgi:hypothetical protein